MVFKRLKNSTLIILLVFVFEVTRLYRDTGNHNVDDGTKSLIENYSGAAGQGHEDDAIGHHHQGKRLMFVLYIFKNV